MNKQTRTYGDLKNRKAELRAEILSNKDTIDMDEYLRVGQSIKGVELMLLYSITPEESCGELPEQVKPKAHKRVKCMVIAISIAVVLAIVLLSGCNVARESCHLVGAACQDIGWTVEKLGDNIATEK